MIRWFTNVLCSCLGKTRQQRLQPQETHSPANFSSHDEDDDHEHHQRIRPSYVYTPPQSLFSIPYQTIDEKRLPRMRFRDITMFGRPMMLLYFLANNPDIMLPLASMRHVFGELATYIPQASASPKTRGFPGLYRNYLRIVVTNRLRYAIDQLFPHLNILYLLYTKGSYNIPELERGPVPILEYIVRDAMALFNPIDYIVTFLEQVVSHYRTLTTEDDRRAYRIRMIEGYNPLHYMYNFTRLYGEYMWDSRWAPDDRLHRLVGVFKTVTTEVFPNAFKEIARMDSRYHIDLSRFISDIIDAIAPCFLHHYRPMQKPDRFCMPHDPFTFLYNYPIPVDQFPALMDTLRSDVVDCTREYLEHPELFSTHPPLPLLFTLRQELTQNEFSSNTTTMVDILTPTLVTDEATTTTTTTTMLQVLPPWTKDSGGGDHSTYNSDDVKRQIDERLDCMTYILTNIKPKDSKYQLPFIDFEVSSDGISHLIEMIMRCPPRHDPVYAVLSPIFDQLKPPQMLRILACPSPARASPWFSCPYPHTHIVPLNRR